MGFLERGGPARWLATVMAGLVCAIVVVWITATEADAHASVVAVEPADGSVVAAVPTVIRLTFSEPTAPLVVALVRPDGSRLALDRHQLRGNVLEFEAPANLTNGTHVLSWRVVSEDGHPIGGASVFSIGAMSVPSGGGVAPVQDPSVRAAIWVVRCALFIGLFVGIGGVFFRQWIATPQAPFPGLVPIALAAGLAATPASLGLQGLDGLGLPLRDLTTPTVWWTGLSTSHARTVLLAAASLVAALVSAGAQTGWRKSLSAMALLGAGLALAASGHASSAAPRWVTVPAVVVHGVSVAFWVGALAPLRNALADVSPDAALVLHRFSGAIIYSVGSLIIAGTSLAVIQLDGVEALWTTTYGRIFLVKLGLLVILFSLAIVNRYRLTVPSERGDAQASRRIARSIALEIGVVVAIVAVAALWRFTPPPRTAAHVTAAPLTARFHSARADAVLELVPGRVGVVSASISVSSAESRLLEAKQVVLAMSNQAAGIEPIRRAGSAGQDGTWRIDGLALPVPGIWSVRMDILISDFELATLEGTVDIRP